MMMAICITLIAMGGLSFLIAIGLSVQFSVHKQKEALPWGLIVLALGFWLIIAGATIAEREVALQQAQETETK